MDLRHVVVALCVLTAGCGSRDSLTEDSSGSALATRLTTEQLLSQGSELMKTGNLDDALGLVETGLQRDDDKRVNLLHMRYAILQKQNDDEALVTAAIDLARYYEDSPKKTRDVAHIYLRLDDPARALEWLRTTLDRGFQDYSDLDRNPVYDPIRSSGSFEELLSRVRDRIGLNQPAKEITGRDLDGKPISLSDLEGSVVLVDFWALYCAPCLAEIESFLEYSERSFEILSINLDEDIEQVKKFVQEKQIPWPVLYSGEGWEDENRVKYGLQNIPSYWLVDRQGVLRQVGLEKQQLKSAIDEIVGG